MAREFTLKQLYHKGREIIFQGKTIATARSPMAAAAISDLVRHALNNGGDNCASFLLEE